jgi:hypothetical protein
VLTAATGALIKGITPPSSFGSTILDYPQRTLLMNSQGNIIFSGTTIALFDISSIYYIWIIENSGIRPIGMILGNPDTSYAAILASDSIYPISIDCYLILVQQLDGTILYLHYFSCNAKDGYLA